jgi:hypothetical protein
MAHGNDSLIMSESEMDADESKRRNELGFSSLIMEREPDNEPSMFDMSLS